MPFPERVVRWTVACTVSIVLGGIATAQPRQPTQAQVEAALTLIKNDPHLNATKRLLVPRFEKGKNKPPEGLTLGPAHWAQRLAEFARLLMWGLGALLIVAVLGGVRSWVQAGGWVRKGRLHKLPSHVGHLDIRPDSLPPSVGRAAWDGWLRGDHSGALSLLYRATLSRLVHGHAVPIVSASTEGECVTLARQHLGTSTLNYVEQLVHAWQMTVYGGRRPTDAVMQDLCQRFEVVFPEQTPMPSSLQAAVLKA